MTSTRLKVLKIKCRKFDWNVFRVYKLTGASRVGTKSELQGSVQIETWIKIYFSSFLLYLQYIKLSHLVLFEIFFPPPQVPNSFPCSCIPFLSSHAKLYKEVCGHLRNLCLLAQVLICLPVPTWESRQWCENVEPENVHTLQFRTSHSRMCSVTRSLCCPCLTSSGTAVQLPQLPWCCLFLCHLHVWHWFIQPLRQLPVWPGGRAAALLS